MTSLRCQRFALLLLLMNLRGEAQGKIPIYIAGLWPMTGRGWLGGLEALPALRFAVDLLNNSTEILPEHEIHLIWRDTQNIPTVGTRKFFDLVSSEPTKVFMIGPATSRCALHVSVAATSWNLVHMSFAARSTDLEDKDLYPYFFRTVPADNSINPACLAILKKFQWNRLAMVYQYHNGNVYEKTIKVLGRMLLGEKYSILTTEVVTEGDTKQIGLVIRRLKELDARIIVGNFFFNALTEVFCEAYKQGLASPKHVWIIPQLISSYKWWLSSSGNCTQEEMSEAASYTIAVSSLTSTTDDKGAFGVSPDEFSALVYKHLNLTECEYCGYAFDAVMSAGLVLHKTHESGLPLEDFTYDNTTYAEQFVTALHNLSMDGISGPVGFDQKGNRIGQTLIQQLQDGEMVSVGVYDVRTHTLTTESYPPVIWPDDKIPLDGAQRIKIELFIPYRSFIPMATLAIVGILLAVGFLIFNFRFRNLRLIKLSSPVMNNFIVLGSVFAYMSVILYGLDGRFLSRHSYDIMCSTRLGFISLGFTFAFGAMFSKTWRVHRIMANKTATSVVIKMKDIHLTGRIMVLLGLDLIFLTVWVVVDPLKPSIFNLSDRIDEKDDDRIQEPFIFKCVSTSELYWVGAMLVYKGILLLFGIFLAWETRNIRVDALNDSRHIGLCVYNTAVICLIGVPLSFIIGDENFEGSYIIMSIFVIMCTTVTLCIVFLPKVYSLYLNPTGDINLRFNTTNGTAISHPSISQSRVSPFEQMKANISIQRRLENALKEKERRIHELETAMTDAGMSSTA